MCKHDAHYVLRIYSAIADEQSREPRFFAIKLESNIINCSLLILHLHNVLRYFFFSFLFSVKNGLRVASL